jgi:hypothetical protein
MLVVQLNGYFTDLAVESVNQQKTGNPEGPSVRFMIIKRTWGLLGLGYPTRGLCRVIRR